MTQGMSADQVNAMIMANSYGDQQSQMTGLRAAYGDTAAQMMMSRNVVGGGISGGFNRMFSDLGRVINPITYTPNARVQTGFYGQYSQEQGFFGSGVSAMGLSRNTWGAGSLEQAENATTNFSSRLVGGGVSATSAMATIAGGFAMAPLTGALGAKAGGALGSTIGMGGMMSKVGRFAGGMLGGYMVAEAATSAVMEGVQARREIQDYLEESSFRFVGAGSNMADPRRGKGMSRSARRESAEFIRSMDIEDPMLNTEELTSILKGADQRGLFVGSGNDIDDFKGKFKSIVENVKKVSKVLHQSLEQGLDTIKELRGVGITDSEVGNAISNAQTLGTASGRTASEMVGLGLQGANMFRGTGVDMGVGFAGSQMNLASIRAARDSKILSQEAISQAGGEEALAMRMTSSGLQFAQSTFGRGYNAAFFDPSSGGLNSGGFMATAMAGGGNFMDTYGKAVNNLSDPAKIIAYQANQEKLVSEMGEKFGGLGLQIAQDMSTAAQAKYYQEMMPGVKSEDAYRFILKNQGMSSTEIDARLATMRNADKTFKTNLAAAGRTRDERIVEEGMLNNDLVRLKEQVKDKFKQGVDLLASPINKFMDEAIEGAEVFFEEEAMGIRRGSLRDVDVNTLAVGAVKSKYHRIKGSKINLDKTTGFLGGSSSGESLLEIIKSGSLGSFTEGMLQEDEDVDIILKKDFLGGLGSNKFEGTSGVNKSNMKSLVNEANRVHSAMSGAKDFFKDGKEKNLREDIKKKFDLALISGSIKSDMGISSLVETVLGKDIDEASKTEIAALTLEGKSIDSLDKSLSESQGVLAGGLNATQSMDAEKMRDLRGRFESIKDKIGKGFDLTLGKGVLENIAAARALSQKSDIAKEKGDTKLFNKIEEQKNQYLSSAIRLQADASGEGISKVSSKINAQYKTLGWDEEFDEAREIGGLMQTLQSERGTNTLSSTLDEAVGISGVRDKNLEKMRLLTDSISMGTSQSRVQSLIDIGGSGSDQTFLKKLGGTGLQINRMANLFKELEGVDSEEASKILRESDVQFSSKELNNLITGWDNTNNKRSLELVYDVSQSKMASDTTVGGKGGGAAGTEGGTAQSDYAKTVSVQIATLHAMEAIAKRLELSK